MFSPATRPPTAEHHAHADPDTVHLARRRVHPLGRRQRPRPLPLHAVRLLRLRRHPLLRHPARPRDLPARRPPPAARSNSCRIYRMDVAYSVDELIVACCELVEKNGLDSCYIRPMVLRGYGAASMVPFASPVHVYLPCWPWGAYLGEGALENGVDACVSSLAARRAEHDPRHREDRRQLPERAADQDGSARQRLRRKRSRWAPTAC